jgi:o-succinylbenzoate synthase
VSGEPMMTQRLQLQWRPFRFSLARPLVTAHGGLAEKRGWLLRLEAGDGRVGWGEAADLGWQPAAARLSSARQASAAAPIWGPAPTAAPVTSAAQSGAGRGPQRAGPGASPARLEPAADPLAAALVALGSSCERGRLEALLPGLPGPLAFALGLALAELDGLGVPPQGWLAAPASAHLLPAGEAMPAAFQALLSDRANRPAVAEPMPAGDGDPARDRLLGQAPQPAGSSEPSAQPPAWAPRDDPAGAEPTPPVGAERSQGGSAAQTAAADRLSPWVALGPMAPVRADPPIPFTVKWKVAAADDHRERQLLEWLLDHLPAAARLRLDANGGWDRATAFAWAGRLAAEPRLEWLEQPLAAADGEGLLALAQRLPVALDESLRLATGQRPDNAATTGNGPLELDAWPGWQVRRPALEGDPRPLLAQLQAGRPRLMLSTALETGIGMRLLAHLAALQLRGPTPTAAGLAPGWRPPGGLFAAEPSEVWQAAAEPA